ncbi:MAG: hypothetical protein ACNA7T_14915 [Haliea sp.]
MTNLAPEALLFVVGMHRSGTSALCAALRACGAGFGEHLLAPMAGVNDDGFWEDADVVAANDALLAAAGGSWYAPGAAVYAGDWPAQALASFQRQASEILQRGFGPGPLWVVKDPRLCLTLPLWLQACDSLGIATRVCVASRSPLEVAHSLQRRDGFPLGYGLRLDLAYRKALLAALPADALQVAYPDLVADPAGVMQGLAAALPLTVDEAALAASVRRDLRHHTQHATNDCLSFPNVSAERLPALASAIDAAWPAAGMTAELVAGFVARATELTALGDSHSKALATIAAKDADIEALAAEHRQALATIAERDTQIAELDQRLQETGDYLGHALATITERDEQIAELDSRLAEIGALHSHALEVIADKDRVIDEIHKLPVLGLAVKAARRARNRSGTDRD